MFEREIPPPGPTVFIVFEGGWRGEVFPELDSWVCVRGEMCEEGCVVFWGGLPGEGGWVGKWEANMALG